MAGPLALDVTHTSHTRALTGVQRVARALLAALGDRAVPVTHDPYLRAWRPLQAWERRNLADHSAGGAGRRAQWPLTARLRGSIARLLAGRARTGGPQPEPRYSGLLVPEIFSPAVAAALPALFAMTAGPRVAVFHDAIALRFPELTPAATVARFPAYLCDLLRFDGIAANSEESRESLLAYWRWLGAAQPPPVAAIPLGVDAPAPSPARPPVGDTPVVLCVGTLEGRKNHAALLAACEQLWAAGRRFDLRLIGRVNTATGAAALRRVRELQAAGRPLRFDGPVSDDALEAAYAACAFTVYPSVAEGFGLPVIESLARGKPCVCSAHGAIGESARGGGCLALDAVDAPALAAAVARLLGDPAELAALAAAARTRTFQSWSGYARELGAWMATLPRH
jgi:glycosyltransferase involved in cell wall biosynthesis